MSKRAEICPSQTHDILSRLLVFCFSFSIAIVAQIWFVLSQFQSVLLIFNWMYSMNHSFESWEEHIRKCPSKITTSFVQLSLKLN